jgi:putative hydrolase of the HAD superfamily
MNNEALNWPGIDTVLLDMDGTLLDLRFDNWFWQELVPQKYAASRGMDAQSAWAELAPRFRAAMGSLDWYCIDFWSQQLDLDIRDIKRSVQEQVRFLPGAEEFLLRLKAMGKRRVLVTNAHPEALAIKNERVDLLGHLEAVYSTHPFGMPKENAVFWPKFQATEGFDSQRTLFIDDNLHVLRAARAFGVRWLRAVRCPDSGRPPKDTGEFTCVNAVADLLG